MSLPNNFEVNVYPLLSVKTLQRLSYFQQEIEYMVHDGMHEDINEYLLEPIYAVLRANGIDPAGGEYDV